MIQNATAKECGMAAAKAIAAHEADDQAEFVARMIEHEEGSVKTSTSDDVGRHILNQTLPPNEVARIKDEMYPTRVTKEGDTYLDVRNNTFDYAHMADYLIGSLDMKVFCSREKPDIPPRLAAKVDGRYVSAEYIIPNAITYLAGKTVKDDNWKAVTNAIKTDGSIKYYLEDLNRNTRKANFMNGVVDISGDTIKLIPHNDNDIFFTRIPHEYAPGYECPVFQEFLDYALDPKYHQFIYEWIGYCFFETYEFQHIIFHHGVQGGGKSSLLNLIAMCLGHSNVPALSLKECSHEKFKLVALSGALANHGSEVSYKDLKDGGEILKRLSSGVDPVTMEQKYKDAYPVVNTAKLTYAMNNLPRIYHDDGGVWRRLKLVKWEKPINVTLGRRFNSPQVGMLSPSEVRGVICKSIEAFHAMLQRDEINFSYTQDVEETRDEYEASSDSIGTFIYDRLEIQDNSVKDPERITWSSNDALYEAYTNWCKDNRTSPKTKKQFAAKDGFAKTMADLPGNKGQRKRTAGGRGWNYIEIVDESIYTHQSSF